MILGPKPMFTFRESVIPSFQIRKELVMNTSTLKQPAIVRIWRGRTPRDHADEYEAYNYEAGIKPLIKKRPVSRRSVRTARTKASS
jgi:hypothetical protein